MCSWLLKGVRWNTRYRWTKYIVWGGKTKKKKDEDIQDKEHKALETKTTGGVEINKELKITTQTVGDRL